MTRIFLRMLLLCLVTSTFFGCATRNVNVVQAEQFKLMADRMSEELIARNIIDASRNYTPGIWGSDEGYGDVLFRRLSAEFLFDDIVGVMGRGSFADNVRNSDRVERRPYGFTIKGLRQQIRVDMVAVTDWDGDGGQDWLVACEFLRARGAIPRIYYVVIAEPAATGTLKGTVAAVYENLGVTGRLYVRDSQVKKNEQVRADSAPAVVEEAMPGLKSVTVPPGTPPPSGRGDTRVKERSLD